MKAASAKGQIDKCTKYEEQKLPSALTILALVATETIAS
jgi:hypothetical protein